MDIRDEMADRMIRIYGFENPIVIEFCRMCEQYARTDWNDTVLLLLVKAHEQHPVVLE